VPPLTAPTVENIDLHSLTVSGTVTLAGGAIPDSSSSRGMVLFVDPTSGASVSAGIGTTGAATYTAKLFAGHYKIFFSGYQSSVLPQLQILVADQTFTASGTLDIDLQVVTLGGAVTVNGAQMPDGAQGRGGVVVRRKDTGSWTVLRVPASGAAQFQGSVFAGSYDIGYDATGARFPALPSQRVYLQKDVSLAAPTTLNLDLPVITVSGTVTRGGAALPDASGRRGSAFFADPSGNSLTLDVGTTGPGTYSGLLFAGTYDVGFDSVGTSVPSLPSQTVVLETSQSLNSNAQVDLDLSVITLQGGVTVNGGTVPDDTRDRGTIILTPSSGGSSASASIGAAGPAAYTLQAYAGTYDVQLDSTGNGRTLPAESTLVRRGFALAASTSLDVALAVAHVSGTVTVNGAAVPDDTSDRGDARFVDLSTGSAVTASVGTSGPAQYTALLYAGKYALFFDSTNSSQHVLPQLTANVNDLLDIEADASQPFDLQTISLSGSITLNGDTMPTDPGSASRGYLWLSNPLTGDGLAIDVGASGAATYQTTVYAGSYDFAFDPGPRQTVLPQDPVRALRGCLDLGAACTASENDLSGNWMINFLSGWRPVSLSLTQSGSTLNGYSSAWWGSGPVTNGSVQGTSVVMTVGGGETADLTGTVLNGCAMSGHAQSSSGMQSDWIAERLE
jgi:hypothetical protein